MTHALYFAKINGQFAVFVGTIDVPPEDQIPAILSNAVPDQIVWISLKDKDLIERAMNTLTLWYKASHPSAPDLEDRTAVQIDHS